MTVKIEPKWIEDARRLRSEGMNYSEIGRRLHVGCYKTIKAKLDPEYSASEASRKRKERDKRLKGKNLYANWQEEARYLRGNRFTYDAIAKKLGLSRSTVQTALNSQYAGRKAERAHERKQEVSYQGTLETIKARRLRRPTAKPRPVVGQKNPLIDEAVSALVDGRIETRDLMMAMQFGVAHVLEMRK